MLTGLGMTETAPFAICANAHEVKSGHIGLPAPGVELKLVPIGDKLEVRFRGPNVTPRLLARARADRRALRRRRLLLQRRRAPSSMDPARPRARLRVRRPHRRGLQALDRHLGLRRPAARARSSPPATAACRTSSSPASTATRSASLIFLRLDACRALRRAAGRRPGASRARRRRVRDFLAAAGRLAPRQRHRQRDPGRARARPRRAAVDRPRRDHRQGLDQPARRADASRRRRRADVPRPRSRRHRPRRTEN